MKRKLPIILLILLSLALTAPAALAQEARIFDQAELFTASEENDIMAEIKDFQRETGMDFVILTSEEEHDGASQQQLADEFYDRGGFGLDSEHSGIIYFIDMNERWHYLSTTGAMIDLMTDERIESAIENCKSYLSRADYAQAVSKMISLVSNYVKKGVPEGQYRYDVVTGQRLTARHKVLTSAEMLICAAIGIVAGLCFIGVVKSRYKLKGSTYDYNFRENCGVRITGREDDYLRTTTTTTRKAEPPQGGGSGGSGGGSGVHTSSGGTSHGGGGGRF